MASTSPMTMPTPRAVRALRLSLLAGAVFVASCSTDAATDTATPETGVADTVSATATPTDTTADTTGDTTGDTTAGTTAETAANTTAETAAVPDSAPVPDTDSSDESEGVGNAAPSPIAGQLDWLLGVFSASDPPTPADLEAHFSPNFLEQVPPDVLVATTADLLVGTEAPFELVSLDEQDETGLTGVAVIESSNGVRFDVSISVGAEPPHLIDGLLLSPALELLDDVDAELLDSKLSGLAAESSLGVYDVTGGECDPLHEIRTDQALPIGSGFKLWVLAELAHQIGDGDAAWDDTVTVVDALRSSPDGEVFTLPTGTEITLRSLAESMISISDNTATDHLMARLGRTEVEASLERIGVTTTKQNIPMLSTGALFQLKFIAAEPNADDYRALDAAGRAALLDDLEAAALPWIDGPESVEMTNADGVALNEPRDLDVEWFATPRDMCRTAVHLAELATRPGLEPVGEILTINPGAGLPLDVERFPTIRFKGGSEPGVLSATWWLERDDGQQFVITGGLSDADNAFEQTAAIGILASAFDLVS